LQVIEPNQLGLVTGSFGIVGAARTLLLT